MTKNIFIKALKLLLLFVAGCFGLPVALVDLTFDASAIGKYAGQKFAYKRVTVLGADLSVPDTWHTGVYREKDDFEFGGTREGYIDVTGNQVASDMGDIKGKWIVTSMQDDANTENFIKEELPLGFFAVFMDAGRDKAGYQKERFLPITQWDAMYKSVAPGRRPEIAIIPQLNPNAVTPATVPTFAKKTANNYTVAAGLTYKAFSSAIDSGIGGSDIITDGLEISATGLSSEIDLGGRNPAGMEILVHVSAVSGTNPTLDIQLVAKSTTGPVKDTNKILQIPQITTTGNYYVPVPSNCLEFIKLSYTIGGTDTPKFTLTATLIE